MPTHRLLLFVLTVAVVGSLLPCSSAQPPQVGTLPLGPRGGPVEVIHVLFVQAQMLDPGEVMFLFPRGDQVPSLITKVDGKEVRAFGVDQKPLTIAELDKRLPGYTGVVVVQAEFEFPDPFFLKVLNEKSVVFVLPKSMFEPMAKASVVRLKPGMRVKP